MNSVLQNSDSKNRTLIDMYKKLSRYIRTIQTLLTEYSKGHFYAVANVLTPSVYNRMSIDINNLYADSNKFPDYENIRMSNVMALQGLYQGILQYGALVDAEAKLEKTNEYYIILHDPEKLAEYIKQMNGRRNIFPESHVRTISAILKPEYAEYIRQHGFPEGAVFDMDKLAVICKGLNIG